MGQVGSIRELEKAYHAGFKLSSTLLLRQDFVNLSLKVLASLIDVLKDECLLIIIELLVTRHYSCE